MSFPLLFGPAKNSSILLLYLPWQVCRSFLPKVNCPTLVMHGVLDPVVPVEHGRYVAKHIQGSEWVPTPASLHQFFTNKLSVKISIMKLWFNFNFICFKTLFKTGTVQYSVCFLPLDYKWVRIFCINKKYNTLFCKLGGVVNFFTHFKAT